MTEYVALFYHEHESKQNESLLQHVNNYLHWSKPHHQPIRKSSAELEGLKICTFCVRFYEVIVTQRSDRDADVLIHFL